MTSQQKQNFLQFNIKDSIYIVSVFVTIIGVVGSVRSQVNENTSNISKQSVVSEKILDTLQSLDKKLARIEVYLESQEKRITRNEQELRDIRHKIDGKWKNE